MQCGEGKKERFSLPRFRGLLLRKRERVIASYFGTYIELTAVQMNKEVSDMKQKQLLAIVTHVNMSIYQK